MGCGGHHEKPHLSGLVLSGDISQPSMVQFSFSAPLAKTLGEGEQLWIRGEVPQAVVEVGAGRLWPGELSRAAASQ